MRNKPVSRILYPSETDGNHSSRLFVTEKLERPTRKRRSDFSERSGGQPELSFPYLVLHREEFTQPRLLPNALTRSYRVISPITFSGWFVFCCTCRHSIRENQMPGRYPARCPSVFGLSSLFSKAIARFASLLQG